MGSMCVSSCRCCVCVSVVHPVAILSAVFCVICILSTSCYVAMKSLLCLPSVRLLRDVASYFNVGGSNSSYNYLLNEVQYLKPTE